MAVDRLLIKVSGTVQGVGFRPFVHGLAASLGLNGYVVNTTEGVTIEVEGEAVESFVERLKKDAPPLARIALVETSPMPPLGYTGFRILPSKNGDSASLTPLSPDVSTCNDCLKELFDKKNRRYLYPFINCTNCGPRYTITRRIPYDRENTTMSAFGMCAKCEAEYKNPDNRRFHAEPNACPKCGPKVILRQAQDESKNNSPAPPLEKGGKGGFDVDVLPPFNKGGQRGDYIGKAVELLKSGAIIAIKGLGGFHLTCDATNKSAVERLRRRKRRNNKPFALMAGDVETVKKYCHVSTDEEALLMSEKRPIVLLRKRTPCVPPDAIVLPEAIAPNTDRLGFMLPYTPLHYLLFHPPHPLPSREGEKGEGEKNNPPLFNTPPFPPLEKGGEGGLFGEGGLILVMTSGNLSEEPIQIDGDEAIKKLTADAFLDHDREIFMRADDSVVKAAEGGPTMFIRRSRGYAPEPIALDGEGPEVLAVGADLKNAFTLTKGRHAIVSQHIGDMGNIETLRFFEETLENLKAVYRVDPVAVACDVHPGYMTTRWAKGADCIGPSHHSRAFGPPRQNQSSPDSETVQARYSQPAQPDRVMLIQHHHAHTASVMAERGIRSKVIGVALDGTGYGTDGNLWGGEFLIADAIDFKRAGHFKYIPLPGGEAAIREPYRTAISCIEGAAGKDAIDYIRRIGFIDRYGEEKINNLLRMLRIREFSPLSSGAGRLFDAVSAILGLCDRNTFEGEAAMALEGASGPFPTDPYPLDIKLAETIEVDFSSTILQIIDDLLSGVGKDMISAKFHNTVIEAIASVAGRLSAQTGIKDIVLSGGVFQNDFILSGAMKKLKSAGLNVNTNELVPANDGGISLGQAYILRERLKAGWEPK